MSDITRLWLLCKHFPNTYFFRAWVRYLNCPSSCILYSLYNKDMSLHAWWQFGKMTPLLWPTHVAARARELIHLLSLLGRIKMCKRASCVLSGYGRPIDQCLALLLKAMPFLVAQVLVCTEATSNISRWQRVREWQLQWQFQKPIQNKHVASFDCNSVIKKVKNKWIVWTVLPRVNRYVSFDFCI